MKTLYRSVFMMILVIGFGCVEQNMITKDAVAQETQTTEEVSGTSIAALKATCGSDINLPGNNSADTVLVVIISKNGKGKTYYCDDNGVDKINNFKDFSTRVNDNGLTPDEIGSLSTQKFKNANDPCIQKASSWGKLEWFCW